MIALRGLEAWSRLSISRTRTAKEGSYHWNRDQHDAQNEYHQRNHVILFTRLKLLRTDNGKSLLLYKRCDSLI